MTPLNPDAAVEESPVWSAGPSEPESATEHQAALDATLFRTDRNPYVLVLELDAGQLRLREEQGER